MLIIGLGEFRVDPSFTQQVNDNAVTHLVNSLIVRGLFVFIASLFCRLGESFSMMNWFVTRNQERTLLTEFYLDEASMKSVVANRQQCTLGCID